MKQYNVTPNQLASAMNVDPAMVASRYAAQGYADGGRVKTHYQDAGAVTVPPTDARMAGLQQMLEKYGPQDAGYGEEISRARERVQAETDAFSEMLKRMTQSPEDAQTSKAELYFRLASAFGSPTKTGQLTENLALAGQQLGEYAQGKRETAAKNRDIMLQVQKMKMDAAKDDLTTMRTLQSEVMRDRRALSQELIKDYVASGRSQSEAGRQAVDMGYTPGTPEYQTKVKEITDLNIQRQQALIDAQVAAQEAAAARAQQQAAAANLLSPTELKMKEESQNTIASGEQALKDLAEAYRLNPNTLAGGWLQKGQQFLYEAAGSNDPKIVNTRVLNNLLGAQGLAKLRATFGGNPTEGERAILLELEGIGSKTLEERSAVMLRAYQVMQDRLAREKQKLADINSRAYRTAQPTEVQPIAEEGVQ